MNKVLLIMAAMLVATGVLVTGSCGGEDTVIEGTGTITFIPLSGGFYGLIAQDGTEYLPTNLDDAFKQDGLQVRFTAEPETDFVSIFMWGTPVRVVDMERAAEQPGVCDEDALIKGTGTITFIPLSGGFYGLIAQDGTEYLPINLDDAFKQDGLQVEFTAQPETDFVSIFMWGTPVSIRVMDASVADLDDLVAGNTAFALALYEQLRGQAGNLVVSPLSISTALAMTIAGARGETEEQMADVLKFVLPDLRLHPAFAALLDRLEEAAAAHEYALANALWVQQGFAFLEAFLDRVRDNYRAGLTEVDFQRDPEAARAVINEWVSEITRERINELLTPGTVDAATRLVLVNAIYLLAAWETPFSPGVTQDRPFTIPGVGVEEVATMAQTEILPYAEAEGLQILELPYEGGQLSMVILLPGADASLSDVEAAFTQGSLDPWLTRLEDTHVSVRLPRFRVRHALSLRDVLSEMGMPIAFSAAADFSGLTGSRDLCLDDVIHEAFVEVDEEGTEAAAATAVVVRLTAMPPPAVEFHADRPFIYLLRDRVTGTILFAGRVVDPRDQ